MMILAQILTFVALLAAVVPLVWIGFVGIRQIIEGSDDDYPA